MGYKQFKKEYFLVLFHSKNQAIRMNYLLEKKGCRKFKLISTPCRLSNGCSYSLKFTRLSDIEYLKEEVDNLEQLVNKVYEIKRVDGKRIYKKVDNAI